MANTFKFISDFVGMECLRILKNSQEVARIFNSDYNKDYSQPFAIGETTQVKLPQRWTIREGLGQQEQGIDRRKATITMQQPFGIDFGWDSVEAALKAERSEKEISDQYLKPAMQQLAQEIDSRAALFAYQNSNLIAGVLGTTPSTNSTYQRAETLLWENAAGNGDRVAVVSPAMMEAFITANAAVFNPPSEIAREFRKGEVGEYANATWVRSMSLYDHTAGSYDSTGTLAAAPAQGATSISLSGTNGQTLKVGDVLAFDYGLSTQVNAVNPSTRRSTGRAATCVVTQDVTLTAGPDTVNISMGGPFGLEGPGSPYQNVSALPNNAATVTLFPGTTTPASKHGVNGLVITRDAFAMVSSKLEMPKAVEPESFQKTDPKTGVSIRFVRAWNQKESRITSRFDVMIGFGALYSGNCAVRLLSLQ